MIFKSGLNVCKEREVVNPWSTIPSCFRSIWLPLGGALVLFSGALDKSDLASEARALFIETKEGRPFAMVDMQPWDSLAKRGVSEQVFSASSLEGILIGCIPNARRKLKCSHDDKITLCSSDRKKEFEEISFQSSPVPLENQRWQVSALRGGFVGEHVAALVSGTRRDQASLLSFICDAQGDEYAVLVSKGGSVTIHALESLLKRPLTRVEGGVQCVEVPIPSEMGGGAFYIKVWPLVEQLLSSAEEEGAPGVHLCFSEGGRSEVLSLVCDRGASWPLFDGKYLVRYQRVDPPFSWKGAMVYPGILCLFLGAVSLCFRWKRC